MAAAEGGLVVLDTTVLVYAVGDDHELRGPCRDLIAAVTDGRVDAVTTVEVIQEFAHVRARRHGRASAARLARELASLLSPLISIGPDDLRAGVDLYERHDRLGCFDAVLAAAAIRSGAAALVSADRAFAVVPGLAYRFPDAGGIRSLVGG